MSLTSGSLTSPELGTCVSQYKDVLHYTTCSVESVVKILSFVMLNVSEGKGVNQAFVDPQSIVPYYVVSDRKTSSPGRALSSGRLNVVQTLQPSVSSDPL